MRVLVATTAHPPGDVRVHGKIANSLIEAGYEVGWIGPAASSDLGRQADPRIAFDWLPALRSRRDRLVTPRRLRRRIPRQSEEVDWIYCPDPDAVMAAIRCSRRLRAAVWFDIHEEYHTGLAADWLGPLDSNLSRNAIRLWIRRLAAKADLVTSPSPQVLAAYSNGAVPHRLLLNAAPASFTDATPAACRPEGAPLRVMHGKPGSLRGTPEIAAAMDLLGVDGPEIEVLCFGSEVDLQGAVGTELAHRLLDPKRRVRFAMYSPVAFSEVPGILSSCHAGIVNYSGQLASASLPNRLFEYMAIGLQVFAAVESPHIVNVIGRDEAGVTFANEQPQTLAAALGAAYADPDGAHQMGQRARRLFLADYTWGAQMEPLLEFLVTRANPSTAND